MSLQQDICVNSTVSREICRSMVKNKTKGVKYTKKRRFRGNQSVSRQSSVKQRRVRSLFDTLLTHSSNDSGTDTEPNVTPLKFQIRVTRSLLQRQNLVDVWLLERR